MRHLRLVTVALVAMLSATGARAQGTDDGTKADAERSIQAYLAIWSSDGRFDAGSVARFYAPHVVYYGKPFSRAQVLADKQAYARHWPERHYAEVPNSLTARCNRDRSRCTVGIVMRWRRMTAGREVSVGRARMVFEFIPTEGGRKIARESAVILSGRA